MAGTGNAKVTTGDGQVIDLNFSVMDPYSYYGGATGESSLNFLDIDGDSLAIGGGLREGTQKTSNDVALSLVVLDAGGEPLSLTSGNGSCRITITTANNKVIEGSFRCPDVKVGKGTVLDATGTFSGRPPARG